MATFIVLLGPPGVGKGTQARILAEAKKLAHISSGDLFRENIKNKTELGNHAREFIDKGELVPDDVTIGMIRERLNRPDCKAGAILDGFPRTPVQAMALEKMLADFNGQISAVPYITAPEEVLVGRIGGRWTCRLHGHVYHQMFNPPMKAGVCDIDDSELYQREDDKVETVTMRIRVYLEQTIPLVEYYRKTGKLVEIDGTKPVELVSKDLCSAVSK
ncbi:MAG: adenylate kinase [Chloroflexi bacterium]|nr:adenylate kinase [Chloroflexota bacterium]